MPKLRFKSCDYDCSGKGTKRGFRVYCRKTDKKCKPRQNGIQEEGKTPWKPHLSEALERKYAPIIQLAVEQDPEQLVHGTHFYIVDGKITDWLGIAGMQKYKDKVMVHSHSATNWEKYVEKYGKEEFEPFSDGDVDILRKGIKKGFLNGMIVIMGDGRMDYLGLNPEALNKDVLAFLKMGPKTLNKALTLPPPVSEKDDYETHRKPMRAFAKSHGLLFVENLHWGSKKKIRQLTID